MNHDPALRNAAIVGGLLLALGAVLLRHQQFSTPPDDPWFQARVIEHPGVVVVKFGAEWCPPCRSMHSSLKQLKSRHGGGLSIVEIDVDKMPHLAQHYGISVIPRTLIFVDGKYRAGRVGASSPDDLDRWVQPFLTQTYSAAQ